VHVHKDAHQFVSMKLALRNSVLSLLQVSVFVELQLSMQFSILWTLALCFGRPTTLHSLASGKS